MKRDQFTVKSSIENSSLINIQLRDVENRANEILNDNNSFELLLGTHVQMELTQCKLYAYEYNFRYRSNIICFYIYFICILHYYI